jgi:hypothetical protein
MFIRLFATAVIGLSSLCLLLSQVYAQEYHFKGTIRSDLGIQCWIKQNGSQVSGKYFYIKNGGLLNLAGTLSGENLTLTESNTSGTVTGKFVGKLSANGFNGSWKSADGKKEYPVVLTALTENQIILTPQKYSVLKKVNTPDCKNQQADKNDYACSCYEEANTFVISGIADWPIQEQTLRIFGPESLLKKAVDKTSKNYQSAGFVCDFPFQQLVTLEGDAVGNAIGIWVNQEWSGGAHPDGSSKPLNLNLTTGKELVWADIFREDRKNELITLIYKEVRKSVAELDCKPDEFDEIKTFVQESTTGTEAFKRWEKNFRVGKNGIEFFVDFQLPYVAKICSWNSATITYQALKPFLKERNPLGK